MHISNQIKAFDYLGSKFSILPWLLPKLPNTRHFVDVFGGGGCVLLNRDPSPIETYNDINGKLVNFFRVLQREPYELLHRLRFTLHSKQEYDEAWFSEADDAIEQARKFFIRTQQSIFAAGGQEKRKGWGADTKQSRCLISGRTNKWINGVDKLDLVIDRFRRVQIENRDFRFILSKYDTEDTLFYLDSPYDPSLRSSSKYEFEFANQDFHDLKYYAERVKGKVAISAYKTDFMLVLFSEFYLHEGPIRKNSMAKREAQEVLFTNYKIE